MSRFLNECDRLAELLEQAHNAHVFYEHLDKPCEPFSNYSAMLLDLSGVIGQRLAQAEQLVGLMTETEEEDEA